MSGPITTGTAFGTRPGNFTCLTGFIRPRSQVDIFQRGTHLLVSATGNVMAILRSNQINLSNLEGRFVTVCGINEGQIEGVTSLLVTLAFPVILPRPTLPPITGDLGLLLLLALLLQNRGFGSI